MLQFSVRVRKPVIYDVDTDSDGAEFISENKSEKPQAAVRGTARRLDGNQGSQVCIYHDFMFFLKMLNVKEDHYCNIFCRF